MGKERARLARARRQHRSNRSPAHPSDARQWRCRGQAVPVKSAGGIGSANATKVGSQSIEDGGHDNDEVSHRRRYLGGCRVHGRHGAGPGAQDRHHGGAVGTAGGARRAAARRLQSGRQARRRQARRASHQRHRAGRRAETRRSRRQGQAARRARQGRLRRRPDLLQHPDGDRKADHGSQCLPDQPERRHLDARRQGLQPVLLRHILPERPAAGGAGQIRAGQGFQEGLPAGAQLSGRQGHDRRLQEALQGRDRR